MSTPKERQRVRQTVIPGVYLTEFGRYLVRVTFNPDGDFYESSMLLGEGETLTDALQARTDLRAELIQSVAPCELRSAEGVPMGVVYNNKVIRPRPLRAPGALLPPPELFKDLEHAEVSL